MKQYHKDPLSAWKFLCKFGGIELQARDQGLDIAIKNRLDPKATNIEEALKKASMEDFIGAFFESLQPYIEMFADILNFFKNSKATEGKENWVLKVDNVDLNLEHFRQTILDWENSIESSTTVPELESSDYWSLISLLKANLDSDIEGNNIPKDVNNWLNEFQRNEKYLPFPDSLNSKNCPPELVDLSLIGEHFLTQLLKLGTNYKDLLESHQYLEYNDDSADNQKLISIRWAETDRWLSTFVRNFAAVIFELESEEKNEIGIKVQKFLKPFPKRQYDIKSHIGDLESILSLPIWKKRYDLYAVWIGTEVITALEEIGHDIQIHDQNGKLLFEFTETLLATILTSPGPFRLICEKRVPLKNPIGNSRKNNAQPDYGLWIEENGRDDCKLSIEVKHYKNSSKKKFKDALEDYAQALPNAKIYLVNHGSIGNLLNSISPQFRKRCDAIGYLKAINKDKRNILYKAVQKCVGDPIKLWPCSTLESKTDSTTCFLFDVSGSMKSHFESSVTESFIIELLETYQPCEFFSADQKLFGGFSTDKAGYTKLMKSGGGATDLSKALEKLHLKYKTVICITDSDGASTLSKFNQHSNSLQRKAPKGILVVNFER